MKKDSEPLTARLEDAKIEEFSGEIETGGLGNFDLHGQNDGGRVSEIGLDTDEGGVIDGLSSEEVGSGNGLRFIRSNLLHCTFHTDHTFFLLHSQHLLTQRDFEPCSWPESSSKWRSPPLEYISVIWKESG